MYNSENTPDFDKFIQNNAFLTVNRNAVVRAHELKWLTSLDMLAQTFSTCAKRQYAAIILAPNKRVIGFGYNGSPPNMGHCKDGHCPRLHQNSPHGSNYDNCIAQHAEAGALLWSDPAQRKDSTLIVNGPPCMGCAKLIASGGISRLIYKKDTNYAQWQDVKSFLDAAGVANFGISLY